MKTHGLAHVAIAVKALEPAIAFYRDVLGLTLETVEEVPDQQVTTAVLRAGTDRLELVCPTAEDSGVARFLQKRGEGIHHLCLEVEDLEVSLKALAAKGVALIDQAPRPGAGGARVAFVHPRGAHGVLLEQREGRRAIP